VMSEATLEYRRLLERFGRRPFLGFRFRYHAELRQSRPAVQASAEGRSHTGPSIACWFFDAFDRDRVKILTLECRSRLSGALA